MSPRAPAADGLASHISTNRRGILAMIGAMACFVVNDAPVKYASQTMPATRLIFIRGVIASGIYVLRGRGRARAAPVAPD